MRPIILHLAHHSTLPGQQGERNMYNTLRREYIRRNMPTDVYNTVQNCQEYPRTGTKFKHQRQLQLFPPSGPLEFSVIDILGPLLRTRSGNEFVLIITDRTSKLIRAFSTPKVSSNHEAHILFKNCVIPYGTKNIILLDDVHQLISKFFVFSCQYLGAKNTTTTACHLQRN